MGEMTKKQRIRFKYGTHWCMHVRLVYVVHCLYKYKLGCSKINTSLWYILFKGMYNHKYLPVIHTSICDCTLLLLSGNDTGL